jgi:thioredoxin-related protein
MAGDDKTAGEAAGTKITWLDYAEGMEVAKSDSSKHVLVDFTASWCGWCKRMERDTFSDSAVIAAINESFIPVKVWGDSNKMLDIEGYKISERDLAASEFKVRGYPAFWFINEDGMRIGPLPGYFPPERFLKALDYVSSRRYEEDMKKQKAESGESKK